MSEILGENNILQPKKVSLSHERSHLLQDQVDIVLGLYDSVQIDVHANIEGVVDISSHESQDQLEYLGCDVILDLANIDPLEGRFQMHRLSFWQYQLPIQNTNSVSFQVDFMEKLDNDLKNR